MNQIRLLVKAFGCVGDDYEGKETFKNKLIEKDLAAIELTEKELKQTLESLISLIKEIKALYPDEQEEVVFNHNNRLESIKFEVTYIDETGVLKVIEEDAFFKKVALYKSLSSLILEYCKVTDDGEEGSRIYITDEYDEAPPAGTYAMLALVHQNKKWIFNYIEFLRTNDLDHEVEQMWHIKAIIEKYGWCDETSRLAIARNSSCCGQGGREQFNYLLENGLLDYLKEGKNRFNFLNGIRHEFIDNISTPHEIKLLRGHKDRYLKYWTPKIHAFKSVLTSCELEYLIEQVVLQWNTFNGIVNHN